MIKVEDGEVEFKGTSVDLCIDLIVLYISLIKDNNMNMAMEMAIATLSQDTIEKLMKEPLIHHEQEKYKP